MGVERAGGGGGGGNNGYVPDIDEVLCLDR